MPKRKFQRSLYLGVAMAAGLLGTLSALLHQYNHRGWAERMRRRLSLNNRERTFKRKKLIIGGVAGGAVGAATALLLAPKSGTDLIKDMTHPFAHYLKKARTPVEPSKVNKRRSPPSVKKAITEETLKAKKRVKSAASAKKTPPRRQSRPITEHPSVEITEE